MYMSIINDSETNQQLRSLIQSFLSARLAALPPIKRIDTVQDESQEYWGDFSFDIDDPDVLALTGVDLTHERSTITDLEARSAHVRAHCRLTEVLTALSLPFSLPRL